MTKRNVLKTIASIFDPIGIAAPHTVIGKMLFQEYGKTNQTGTELKPPVRKQWKKWRQELELLGQVQVPRFSGYNEKFENQTIHIFGDASKKAYGAVAFLQSKQYSTTSLLLAKHVLHQ